MGHTNSTANLALPQFIGTDKPTWLGDINSAFSDIDAYAGTNDAAVAGAVADAASAVSQASSAVSTATAANTTAGNANTTANNAIGVANTANAIAGTVDAKVGLLANLHTADRTSIVNAINELADDVKVSVTADGVKTYGQLLDELYALIDNAKLNSKSVVELPGGLVLHVFIIRNTYIVATACTIDNQNSGVYQTLITSSGSKMETVLGATYTNTSSTVVTSGEIISIVY